MIRVLFILFMVITILACSDVKDAQINKPIIPLLELDTFNCCRPNLMGCTPYGNMLITKTAISNKLFCLYLNRQPNSNISMLNIFYENGQYSVQPGFEQKDCKVQTLQLAYNFTIWYNKEYYKAFGKDSIDTLYEYGKFEIPTKVIIKDYKECSNLQMKKNEGAIMLDSSYTDTKNSNLYLIKLGRLKRSRGVEF